MSPPRRALAIGLALAAATALAYAPVARYGFVNFDDPGYVYANPIVAQGLTRESVAWAFSAQGHGANWHPLTSLSHLLDVQLFGMNAGAHHVVNVLLHIAAALLLFALLRRTTGADWRSAFVAGLFALHPMHVESVAWISERKDVLSTVLWMLTSHAWVRWVREPTRGGYLAVCALFALGLMAKAMLVTLPFVLLLFDRWPLRRTEPWRQLVLEKLPLVALALAASLATLAVQSNWGSVDPTPFDLRLANASVSYVAYIGKLLWPANLAVFYPLPPSISAGRVVAVTVALVVATVAVLREARRRPYLSVGWLWYLGTLVPVIGVVQVGGQAMADRYTYIPSIGLFVLAVWGACELAERAPRARAVLPYVAGLVLATCAVATRFQVLHWKDSVTLWAHSLESTGPNDIALRNLGSELAAQRRHDEIFQIFSRAAQEQPGSAVARFGLAYALEARGKSDEAIAEYREAVRIHPGYADAHHSLGMALMRRGDLPGALVELRETARLEPGSADVRFDLGVILKGLGRADEAAAEFREALRINPRHARALREIGQ